MFLFSQQNIQQFPCQIYHLIRLMQFALLNCIYTFQARTLCIFKIFLPEFMRELYQVVHIST